MFRSSDISPSSTCDAKKAFAAFAALKVSDMALDTLIKIQEEAIEYRLASLPAAEALNCIAMSDFRATLAEPLWAAKKQLPSAPPPELYKAFASCCVARMGFEALEAEVINIMVEEMDADPLCEVLAAITSSVHSHQLQQHIAKLRNAH
jgi:hypothetical protein